MRWLGRLALGLLAVVLLLLSPVAAVEIACRGEPGAAATDSLLPEDWRRPESRTLLTYPEWHIVHAYDDYATVISAGDPHEYGFLRGIAGFWQALCPLKARAEEMGPVTFDTRLTIYTIGVSFTAELLAKAAYEETLGRVATWIRGPDRARLDDVSARHAFTYAEFLQQVPWYRWDFDAARADLAAEATGAFRDRERRVALGLEYRVKAAYARVLTAAMAGMAPDALRMRSVVTRVTAGDLDGVAGVEVVGTLPEGVVIETDRYRLFTLLVQKLAADGARFVEIAGNDEILFTALSERAEAAGALTSFARQGHGDWRHLFLVPVAELTERIAALPGEGLRLEHVHDY